MRASTRLLARASSIVLGGRLGPGPVQLGVDEAAQQVGAVAAHRRPDPVRREPGGLVAAADRPPKLVRREALGRLEHQVHGDEPLPDGQVRAVEERARGDAELVAACVAVPLRAALEPEQPRVLAAARALDAAGPAQVAEVGAALLLEVVVARCAREAEPGGDLGSEDAEIGRNV